MKKNLITFTLSPCLPFLVCPSFLQLLSHKWASYLPVHLCLLNYVNKHTKNKKIANQMPGKDKAKDKVF